MKRPTLWLIPLLGVIITALFGCSSDGNQFSPEEVLNKALDDDTASIAYYAEAEMKTYENGTIVENLMLKEWVSEDGKRRTETESKQGGDTSIAVNDGKKLISYLPDQNQAFIIEAEKSLALNQFSPKEQAEQLLSMIQETHEIELGGEEKVAGRDTYKISAKAKDKASLWGDQELWIDKEHWMVLKMVIRSGDTTTEMEYTKVDFKARIPPSTFTLDLPEDVELADLDDLAKGQTVTLSEAAESIGHPFLHFPETNGLTIVNIELYDLKGELNRKEVNIDYVKEGLPYLSLTVFPSPENEEETELFPGEEEITVRGQPGTWMDMDQFRSLVWQEEGITYSILLNNPNLTKDELLSLTESMIPVKK
jgi:outer membrane lipoprotein-sorting protein